MLVVSAHSGSSLLQCLIIKLWKGWACTATLLVLMLIAIAAVGLWLLAGPAAKGSSERVITE